ncbi:F-box protein At3g07870-like [Cornus florida]|uniref:F-box protein At3g07870-like n=1 Tax=Cornus florida TaxID=4283 RepID=UPI002897077A|nr:F-box protein At3g07870-like [Cornus florida]
MPSFSISSRGNGVLVNGALHWIMTSKKCEWSSVIVYFDLMEEKFKEVPKPDCGSKFGKLDLVDLRGWLCVYGWRDQRVMEVWAMKEYGKKESWIKLITIPIQIESNFFWSLKPLCLMKNGEVLVETGNSRELAGYRPREVYVEIGNSRELAVYNPEEGTIKPPQCFWYYGLRAATYVESLVLLNDGDYTTKV